jgi:FMN phosphatase YigB (HAD superfamily)
VLPFGGSRDSLIFFEVIDGQTNQTERNSMKKNTKNRTRNHGHNTAIVHKVGRHSIELVLTDMDLTLTDAFWAYFIPTMEYEVPRIAKILGETDLDVISREIGIVVNKYGTHECPWLLEIALRGRFKGTDIEFQEQIADPFWATMERNRHRYSVAYPFVKETLMALREAGIPVAIVSDGPMYMVLARAKATGIDELVSGIYALETVEPGPEAGLSEVSLAAGRKRVTRMMGTKVACPFRVLPIQCEKPSDGGARIAMNDFKVTDGKRCLFVGDSLKKDGGAAKAIGAGFIWAAYGLYSISPRGHVLVDVKMNPEGSAPKQPNEAGGAFMPQVYPPMLCAAPYFAEVLNHLGRETTVSTGTILPPSARATATTTVGH